MRFARPMIGAKFLAVYQFRGLYGFGSQAGPKALIRLGIEGRVAVH